MKREREISEEVVDQRLDMAKCLNLLSRHVHGFEIRPKKKCLASAVFECKTCNRQFPSFQALGGHRTSHRRPRLMAASDKLNAEIKSSSSTTTTETAVAKPKRHECTICGQEFTMGQALGGHMRRHRSSAAAMAESFDSTVLRKSKSNNSRRIFGLDLNLTPLENDLEILFGKMAPNPSFHVFV